MDLKESSSINTNRIDHLYHSSILQKKRPLILHYGDVTDSTSVSQIIKKLNQMKFIILQLNLMLLYPLKFNNC